MISRDSGPRHRTPGFTLLEVLLSISVGATLMIAVIGLAFSMTDLWGSTSEPRLFAQHVRGVTRFLDNVLRQAEPPPEISSSVQNSQTVQQRQQQQTGGQVATSSATTDQPRVAWQRPRGRKYGAEEFLTFELTESPGIFAWPEQALPFVVCALRIDPDEGLFLLWKSRLEIDYEDEAPREFRVSPYVTGVTYYYYDTSGAEPKWEKSDQPRSTGGDREIPARIELTFEYKGDKQIAALVIPPASAGVPVY